MSSVSETGGGEPSSAGEADQEASAQPPPQAGPETLPAPALPAVASENAPASIEETAAALPPALTSAQLFARRRDQIEREFLDVQRACIFYAALLLPLLAIGGWCYHRKEFDNLGAELVGGGLLYAITLGFSWLWRGELRGLFAWPRDAKPWVWAVTLVTPVLTLISVSVFMWLIRNWNWPTPQGCTTYRAAGWPVPFIYAWIAVLPAFFEEIAFRGLMLGKLRRVMTPLQAIWVTSILFGILHFTVISLAVFLVPLALVAGWLTHRTRSLWPAMIIHFLHNAGITTIDLFF